MSVVSVVCCQVEVSATGRSLVQRISTEYGVSECHQVQQYPYTPTTSRQTDVRIRKKVGL
jgi:hypothetical protein